MTRDKFDYTHGDTGSKPGSALDFQSNGRPDSQNFDWWWHTVINKVNKLWDEFSRLDSDNDGVVDKADNATNADDADKLDGNHFSDVKNWVTNNSYQADGNDSFKFETRTSDPSNPDDGRAWIRTDL